MAFEFIEQYFFLLVSIICFHDIFVFHFYPQLLTSQLRELENDKLITRIVYHAVPQKVEYSATDLGQSLVNLLFEMKKGEIFMKNQKNKF